MKHDQYMTEALQSIANELTKIRLHLEGPSQTGAAFLVPGALVTVNNPRSEWYGATGRVHTVGGSHSAIDFSGEHNALIDNNHLEKANDK